LDPYAVYHVLTTNGSNFLVSLEVPLMLTCNLLIAFYWAEVIDSSKTGLVIGSLVTLKEKFRWPCLAMLGVIFIIELISDIGTLAFFTVTALIIITVVFYIVMLIVTSIFFLFNGIRIVRLQKSASTQDPKTERKSKRLTRMSTMIMVCSVGMFFLLVSFLTVFVTTPWLLYIRTWLTLIGLESTALAQALVFVAPSDGKSSDSGSNNKSGEKTATNNTDSRSKYELHGTGSGNNSTTSGVDITTTTTTTTKGARAGSDAQTPAGQV